MRIRSIKPDFFRHGGLQDLEAENAGQHVMLVYAGLWGLCDNQGVFPCEARRLKLDVLPFLDFSMEKTIGLLEGAGFLVRYKAEDGKVYGYIPTFCAHQRITGKEAIEGKKYPMPLETTEKQERSTEQARGNTGETPGKHPDAQEGKGREKEREGSGSARTHTRAENESDFFINGFEAETESPPELRAAPPTFTDVAQQMTEYFKNDEAGVNQWKYMEGTAGAKVEPGIVCLAWAGKASPYELLHWKENVGRLVNWVANEAKNNRRQAASGKKQAPSIEKIDSSKYEAYA